ncbi:MAG: glutamate racemase [Spirochaetota bacterium]
MILPGRAGIEDYRSGKMDYRTAHPLYFLQARIKCFTYYKPSGLVSCQEIPLSAIGVFDSGVGGLTVAEAIQAALPAEDIVYIGDTARVPYGNKSKKSIIEFSFQNVKFLLDKGVKIIVVACNTASAAALPALVERFSVPIIGVIDAGVRKALSLGVKRIGVIGTYRTVMSGAYETALTRSNAVTVVQKPCPLFVPIIEENFQNHPAARLVIQEYLDTMASSIDALILGCTHYPLIKSEIARIYPSLTLVDSATAVAEDVDALLSARSLRANDRPGKSASHRYYVTDLSENFVDIARRILGTDTTIEEISL